LIFILFLLKNQIKCIFYRLIVKLLYVCIPKTVVMKIKFSYVLLALVALLSVFYIGNETMGDTYISLKIKAFIIPLLTFWYLIRVKDKRSFFLLFLITFSISELLEYDFFGLNGDQVFFLGNILYILGYLSLIFEICIQISKKISFIDLLKKYTLYVLVLLIVGGFLLKKLNDITRPDTEYIEFVMIFIFSISVLVLMSISFLNYIHDFTKKSLFLFIASVCIAFSEVIQIVSFYLFIDHKLVTNFLYALLYILALFFYMRQTLFHSSIDKVETI